MPAKIRLEVDNATRPGFNEASADLQKLADKLGITQDAAKGMKKELDARAYAEYRKEVKRAADELDGTAARMREVAKEAENLKRAQKDAADAREQWAALGGAVQVARGAFEAAKVAAQVFFDAAKTGAAAGVEESERLVNSVSDLANSYERAKIAAAGTDFGRAAAQESSVLIKNLGEILEEAGGGFVKTTTAATMYANELGLVSDRTRDAAVRTAKLALEQRQLLFAKAEGAKNDAAIRELIAEDARRERQAALEKIKSQRELNEMRREELAQLRELEKPENAGNVMNEAMRIQQKERIRAIDERRRDLAKEIQRIEAETAKAAAEAAKKAADDERKAAETRKKEWADQMEAQRQWHHDQQRLREDRRKRAASEAAEQMRYLEEAADLRRRLEEETKQRQQAKLEQFGEGNVRGALGQLSPDAVRRKVLANRQEQAQAAANSFLNSDEAGDMGRAEMVAQGRKIYRDKMKSFGRLSNASGSEVAEAQQALVGKQLDAAVSGGRASAEAAKGFREAVAAFQRQQQENEEVAADVAEVRQFLQSMTGRQGRRSRDQKFGSR